MLAEIPIGFWAFWLGVGLVVYVAFVWTMVRLAVRSDTSNEETREALTDETKGSRA